MWNVWSPPGCFVNGHSLMICNIVCLPTERIVSFAPVVQNSCTTAMTRRVQSFLLRSKPGWRMVGSVIRNLLGTSCMNQSTFQASSTDQLGAGHCRTYWMSGWQSNAENWKCLWILVDLDITGFCAWSLPEANFQIGLESTWLIPRSSTLLSWDWGEVSPTPLQRSTLLIICKGAK